MKKNILFIGYVPCIEQYIHLINDSDEYGPRFNAIYKKDVPEAAAFTASCGIEIPAIIVNRYGEHGPELGSLETGARNYTGAAIIRHMRKHAPNSMFFMLDGNNSDLEKLKEHAGGSDDIIRLDHSVNISPHALVNIVRDTIGSLARH